MTIKMPGEVYLEELALPLAGAGKSEIRRSAGWTARAVSLEAGFLPLLKLRSFPLRDVLHLVGQVSPHDGGEILYSKATDLQAHST